ncbi:MAG: nuclear transport factor 2 family protein [Planctomycetota bacterium]|jgi:steroid delta-isomerase-like uncharacterized protein
MISPTSPTSPEEAERLVDELYVAWTLHEPGRIDAIFDEDGVYEDVAGGQVHKGKTAIKKFMSAAFAWSPDLRSTRQSFAAAGEMGWTEWLLEGTPGTLADGEGTSGARFRLRGASVLRFKGGKIARVTDYYDMATLQRQLGPGLGQA